MESVISFFSFLEVRCDINGKGFVDRYRAQVLHERDVQWMILVVMQGCRFDVL